jgi:hypothetical protein
MQEDAKQTLDKCHGTRLVILASMVQHELIRYLHTKVLVLSPPSSFFLHRPPIFDRSHLSQKMGSDPSEEPHPDDTKLSARLQHLTWVI